MFTHRLEVLRNHQAELLKREAPGTSYFVSNTTSVFARHDTMRCVCDAPRIAAFGIDPGRVTKIFGRAFEKVLGSVVCVRCVRGSGTVPLLRWRQLVYVAYTYAYILPTRTYTAWRPYK